MKIEIGSENSELIMPAAEVNEKESKILDERIIPSRIVLKESEEISKSEKKKFYFRAKNCFYNKEKDPEDKKFLIYPCPKISEELDEKQEKNRKRKIFLKKDLEDFLFNNRLANKSSKTDFLLSVQFLDRNGRLVEESWTFFDYLSRIGFMHLVNDLIYKKRIKIKNESQRKFLALSFLRRLVSNFFGDGDDKEKDLNEFFSFIQKGVIAKRLKRGKKIDRKYSKINTRERQERSQYEEDPYFTALLDGGGYIFPQELSLHHDYLDAIDVLVEVDLEEFNEEGIVFLGVQRTLLKDEQRLRKKRNKIRQMPFVYLPEYPNRNPVFRFVFPEKVKDYYLKEVLVGDRKISRWEVLKDILQEKGKKNNFSSAHRFVYQTFLGNDFSNNKDKDYDEEDKNRGKREEQDFETDLQGLKAMRKRKDLLDNAKLRMVDKSFALLGTALLELEIFKNRLESKIGKQSLAKHRFYQLAGYYQKVIRRMMYLIDKDQQKEQLREEGFSEREMENLLEK